MMAHNFVLDNTALQVRTLIETVHTPYSYVACRSDRWPCELWSTQNSFLITGIALITIVITCYHKGSYVVIESLPSSFTSDQVVIAELLLTN